jgi:hypothetical protein
MADQIENGTVPPFYKPASRSGRAISGEEKNRSGLSMLTMILGWVTLTVAMIGGGKLMLDILTDGLEMSGWLAKVISLGLTFILGWVVSLVCIRVFGNLILPVVVKIYVFLVVGGILLLYGRVAQKLFFEAFNPLTHYFRYSIAIGLGFAVLIGLHLLLEDHDLRPFAMPILFGGVAHLSGMVIHYVFMNGKQIDIWGDVYFFALMMVLALLMLAHFGIFNLPRRIIKRLSDGHDQSLRPQQ